MNTKLEPSYIDRYAIAKKLYSNNDSKLRLLPLKTLETFFDRNIYEYLPKEECDLDYLNQVHEEFSWYGECFILPNEGKVKKLFAKVIQDTFLTSYTDEQLSNPQVKDLLKAHFEKEQEFITKTFNAAFDKFVEEAKWREEIQKEASSILNNICKPGSYEINFDFDENGNINLNSLHLQLDEIGIEDEEKNKIINDILEQIKINPTNPQS